MRNFSYVITGAAIIAIIVPLIIVSIMAPNRFTEKEIVYESSRNITVWLEEKQQSVTLPLEEYVAGVVASEMPASFEVEALKAQAVAARTYGLAREGNLCDTQHCQVYTSQEELRESKGDDWMLTYWDKIRDAVYGTAGEVLYYDGKLAGQAMFHSSSGGYTENSEAVFVTAVPYLRSVSSPYEKEATHRNEKISVQIKQFVSAINDLTPDKKISSADVIDMYVSKRTDSGRVAEIRIGTNVVSGEDMRTLFSLSSTNFSIEIQDEKVTFITMGFGHGVGMSQYGANGMAEKGYTYEAILKHYYTGVEIKNIAEGKA